MHKGYTLNYFINFFKSIPARNWTEGKLHEEGTGQYCALGHAVRHGNSKLGKEVGTDDLDGNARVEALEQFLSGSTAAINDGDISIAGTTPRARILRALRNRKRYGHILGRVDNT
jgi:hypothetical protein